MERLGIPVSVNFENFDNYCTLTICNTIIDSHLSCRHNTWEPEENVLDARLIEIFEQSQKKTNLKPAKRGPKPKQKLKTPVVVSQDSAISMLRACKLQRELSLEQERSRDR